MNTTEQIHLSHDDQYYRMYLRVKSAILEMKQNKVKRRIFIIYILSCFWVWGRIDYWGYGLLGIDVVNIYCKVIIYYLVSFVAFIMIYGRAFSDFWMRKGFFRIGLVNRAGEAPVLMKKIRKEQVIELVFESRGIPLSKWEDDITELENILDITISGIKTGKTAREIHVYGCSGKNDYDSQLIWQQQYQTSDDKIRIGESIHSPVYINLCRSAHVLIGGATGSGKTWLLKHMLMQCVNKGYQVVIADFKGGTDYPAVWKRSCKFMTDEESVINALEEICEELQRRQGAFATVDANDIDTYNRNGEDYIRHIIFACDELAELLDTTGLSKEEKEIKRKIERGLSYIARLGRAYGIHLFLATQRPDADILNGQIKNNMTYRICGRADDILSRIILDNTEASERIPKDAEGLFLNQDGTVFKAYIFDQYEDIDFI